MSTNLSLSDSDKLEVLLKELEKDSEDVKNNFLRDAGKEIKAAIVRNIPVGKKERINEVDKKHDVHMKDDVVARLEDDKVFGGKKFIVRGGKATGTLWHLVNDGTYRSRPTHFMDKALSEADPAIERILDLHIAFKG